MLKSLHVHGTATDACGNSASCVQVITVVDTIAPVFDGPLPMDTTVQCDAIPEAPILTATDNCDEDVFIMFGEVITEHCCPNNDCEYACSIIRFWWALDDCGNMSQHIQNITVVDTTAPTFNEDLPSDTTVLCDAVFDAAILTASDNCDPEVPVIFEESTTPGDCPNAYTITRTWTAEDDCENVATHVQVVTVVDTIAPYFNEPLPDHESVECDNIPQAVTLTATDNCDEDVSVMFAEERIDGPCLDSYNIKRIWSVTDDCYNTRTHVQMIRVFDRTAPEVEPLADITVQCINQVPDPDITLVSATDNCDDTPSVAFMEDISNGDICPEIISRWYVVSDNCRNSTRVMQTIIVNDTIAPLVRPMPDIIVQCADEVPRPDISKVFASDNCDDELKIWHRADVSDEQTCPETINRYYMVMDDCENATAVMQTIIVNDTTPPDVRPMPDIIVECADEVPEPNISKVFAEDNCDDELKIWHRADVSDGQTCPETISRYYMVMDDCENATAVMQTIIVNDTTPPDVRPMPPIHVECIDEVPVPDISIVYAEDICDKELTIIHRGDISDNESCPETITRYYIVSDDCDNSALATQTIIVNDVTNPYFVGDLPRNIKVECDAIPAPAELMAEDNCDDDVEVTLKEMQRGGNCPNAYTIVRNWTATDDCGNSAHYTQVITVVDTTAPEFNEPLPANTTVECDQVPDPAVLTATDNCDPLVEVEFEEEFAQGDCPDSYTLTRTWTVTDDCGNTASHTQVVTVEDTTGPVFDGPLPMDMIVECDAIPEMVILTATDNCDDDVLVLHGESIIENCCPEEVCIFTYQIVRFWIAVDDCGNRTEHVQRITVRDTTAPVFDAPIPADMTVECDAVPEPAEVTATDNCDTTVTITFTEVRTDGTCPDSYTLTRTWVAMDICENSATLVQVITVQDTQAPILLGVPEDMTAACDQIPAPAQVTAEDNCDNEVMVDLNEVNEVIEGCGTITRTWSAADDCGNAVSATQVITVIDTVAPMLSTQTMKLVMACDAILEAPIVEAMDNCDSTLEVILNEDNQVVEGCGTITRTWSVKDNCGNETVAVHYISVIDTVAPVLIGVPDDAKVACTDIPEAPVVTAEDNCDPTLEVIYREVNDVIEGCGTITRTWYVEDNCGNETMATQMLYVYDIVAPELIGVPADTTVACDAIPQMADVTAEDNCDPTLEIEYSENSDVFEGCGTITRTWFVEDNCGNETTMSQTITVVDNVAPELLGVPADTTVACDAIPRIANVTAEDNCDPTLEVNFEEVNRVIEGCGIIMRMWSVTDNCGNETSATQTIEVIDTVAPTLLGVPQDVTVPCTQIPRPALVEAEDNCDFTLDVIFEEDNQVIEGCGTITRTWYVMDNCGNAAEATQSITVVDEEAPVLIGVPEDTTVACSAIPAPALVTADDNCDPTLEVMFEELSDVLEGCGIITRTWSVEDNCGNKASMTQTIEVIDTVAPMLSTQTMKLVMACDAILEAPIVEAMDNCDSTLEVILNEDNQVVEGCGMITRTWSVMDNCGNETVAVHYISVIDTVAPVLLGVPEDMTVDCSQIPAPADVAAQDNCDPTLEVMFDEDNQVVGGCGYIIRTWTVEDNCGNIATGVHTIKVEDVTAPEFTVVPEDATIECPAEPQFGEPEATDDCGNVTITFEDVFTPGICPNAYSVTRIWTATDECDNSTIADQTITVEDNMAPVFTYIPEDMTIECDQELVFGSPEAEDACGPVRILFEDETTPGDCPNAYTVTRTWTAVDACGHETMASQTITVEDTTRTSL